MTIRPVRSALVLALACALAVPSVAGAAALPILDQYGNPATAPGTTPSTTPSGNAPGTSDPVGSADGGSSSTGDGTVDPSSAPTVTAAAATDDTPEVTAAATTAATSDTVGNLPFTGAELRTLALAAIALIGSGAVLRRVGYARKRRARA